MLFVSPAWVAENAPRVRILDASWHLPAAGRDAAAEFTAAHVPAAQRFDLDLIADPDAPLARTAPAPDVFAKHMEALGISETDHVVVYDSEGLYSAARAWWMFRLYGHAQVSILAGGLPAWRAAGLPLATGAAEVPAPASYSAGYAPELLAHRAEVMTAMENGTARILDARATAAFAGSEAPRTGHIPTARNLPFPAVVAADGTLKAQADLAAAFADAGVAEDAPLILSCGSGVTACILAVAAESLGRDWKVYGGSWADWASDPALPVAKGAV